MMTHRFTEGLGLVWACYQPEVRLLGVAQGYPEGKGGPEAITGYILVRTVSMTEWLSLLNPFATSSAEVLARLTRTHVTTSEKCLWVATANWKSWCIHTPKPLTDITCDGHISVAPYVGLRKAADSVLLEGPRSHNPGL